MSKKVKKGAQRKMWKWLKVIVYTSQTQIDVCIKRVNDVEWDLIPTVKLFDRNGVEMEVIGKRYRKSRQQQENPKEKVKSRPYPIFK